VAQPQPGPDDAECLRLQSLVERVKARDEAALAEVLNIIRLRAYGRIRSVLGAVDPQDVFQHVAIKLWEDTPGWQGCGQFWGWVGLVAKRAALDELRKRRFDPLPANAGVAPSPDDAILLDKAASFLLRDVTEPHYTLCALANKLVGYSLLDIEEERHNLLAEWFAEMEALIPAETTWRKHIQPLKTALKGPAGTTCLNDYGLPADRKEAAHMIGQWIYTMHRRALAAAVKEWKGRSSSGDKS
jgi:DNA-directed RNA polymerase specialized sigma24 family protein